MNRITELRMKRSAEWNSNRPVPPALVRGSGSGRVSGRAWSCILSWLVLAMILARPSYLLAVQTKVEIDFPPPESQGGWRQVETEAEIETIGGMDKTKLAALRQWLLDSDDRPFAAVVIRRGTIVLQVERGNSAVTDARRVASVSKAICATVLAIASERSQQGLTPRQMKFDDRAFDFIPWAQPLSDPRKEQITIKQLLNHTSGVCPEAMGAPNDGSWDYVLGHSGDQRTAKLAFDPGTACGYSSHGLVHASLVCETVTGKPYDQFAIEALFQPLGIEKWWFQYYEGGSVGRKPSHGLGLPVRELARIGYCMLQSGRWHEKQVIPEWFVEQTALPSHQVTTPEMRWKLNPAVFTLGWELPARHFPESGKHIAGIPLDARYKPGSGGQLLAFVPSLDLVIARQTGLSGAWDYEEFLSRACEAVIASSETAEPQKFGWPLTDLGAVLPGVHPAAAQVSSPSPAYGRPSQREGDQVNATAEVVKQSMADQSMAKMKVPEGFVLELVAAEPLVRQPVAIDFDDRGRLWVIQYLQYPNPNGLKRVSVDRFSRTKYDRVPEPPPHGPRGDDRITILEDTDGDGRMDREHDFVNGLNLTSGMAFGHGGVYVLNVPYLLFYPDHNRDDVPDSDPEVLLTGFGMEDAHSVANSLTFGPDGWLYGCQGSTVTSNIRGIEFQQGVWRYHPATREFELFCEGGGNSWGLDFDRTGRLLYSTNYGGYTLLHGVQGGYFVKSFGKHGALHNSHAYGYFEHAPHQNFRGGHVTVGGIVYQGESFPASFRGKYIAGDLLGHGVYWHSIHPHGSTVTTSHGGELLTSDDSWFAPTDVTLGPDGAIYVSDWHDQRTAHPDPDADWDRSNGRIYRIAAAGTKRSGAMDMSKLAAGELFRLHQHQSQWFVRKARQEMVRRYSRQSLDERDRADADWLRAKFHETVTTQADETAALEGLWSLSLLGRFDETLAAQLLNSPHAAVRSWTVRLLGDNRKLSIEMAHLLDKLAEQEPEVSVRQQLACSAARFPAHQALPLINANINRDIDADDPYMPLLWWWAVEKHSVAEREEVLKRFVRPTLWKSKLGRDALLPRLIRRYTAERSADGLASVVRLLKGAPDQNARQKLWPPVWLGWQEQTRDLQTDAWLELARNHEFSQLLLSDWAEFSDDLTLLQLGCALRHAEPIAAVKRAAFDSQAAAESRVALLGVLGPVADKSLLASALDLLANDPSELVRAAALQMLARFDDPAVAKELVRMHQSLASSGLQSQIRDVILSRASSASLWLAAVDRGEISAASTPLEQVRRVAILGDPHLDTLVAKHWGKMRAAPREDKLAEVRRLNNDLRAGLGNAVAGHLLFKKHCAACHELFGEGTKVGPDLTSANRQDRDFLLVSLVDPSNAIRKEFVSVVVQTTSGQILTGLAIERSNASLTLVDAKGEKQTIATAEIQELKDSSVSLMPDNLHLQWKPAELRDLFAYLQLKQ